MLGILKATNFALSLIIILVVLYAFTFHHLLNFYNTKVFNHKNDSKISGNIFQELIQITFLLFFSSVALFHDITPKKTNSVATFSVLDSWSCRGIFHIWFAINMWLIFPNSMIFENDYSPKCLVNYTSWAC